MDVDPEKSATGTTRVSSHPDVGEIRTEKKPWWHSITVMGSTLQIIIAAVLGIAIGVAVSTTVDEVPEAAITILEIPGELWLRGLKASVLPLIATAMIIAVQRLKEETAGAGKKLGIYTVGYYVLTTVLAIAHSTVMTALVWAPRMPTASQESLALDPDSETDQEYSDRAADTNVADVVVQIFESFVPANVVEALSENELLAVLTTAVVVGFLVQPGGSILRAVVEVEQIIMKIITFLIKIAPIGVFFLIMPNLLKLDIAVIAESLGWLIAGSLTGMAIHVTIVTPLIYFSFTRKNPYTFFLKCSPAWVTAWGTASSAATMPVTLRVAEARGVPETIRRFAIPLGTLVNMDGTAIYFPVVVTFLAETQGKTLDAGQYVLIVLLSTLSSIATTPIPSSSLVLTVMIANSVGLEMTGMYGVVVAIDWFLDRFRTAINVVGDLYACKVIERLTGITEDDVAVGHHSPGGDDGLNRSSSLDSPGQGGQVTQSPGAI
ncbi:Sodium:dicarboxylate symporter family protein [Apiospora marii]|uniref:Amino acid transporter n=1 Tax=Apiospora marii TaxID=335849 RepID=A0ABR1RDX4_9PEZI